MVGNDYYSGNGSVDIWFMMRESDSKGWTARSVLSDGL